MCVVAEVYWIFSEMNGEEISFPTLASILRAANAYGFTSLHKWAKHQFESMWPTGIDEVPMTPHASPFILESFLLAQECNIPKVLKRLFYELIRVPGFDIFILVQLKLNLKIRFGLGRSKDTEVSYTY